MKKKRGKKIMLIAAIIIGVIIVLNIIGIIINATVFKDELKAIAPYGKMVDVDGRQMHVHAMGEGETTIVLLPGFGVSLPTADFGPLMRQLSAEHTVVALEFFGVGFSDQNPSPRTNEHYTHEIRTALAQAGFKAPYVLMPHSASGIYCEYYAATYPEEVSAIVMLDTTSTAMLSDSNPPRFLYSIGKFQQATGVARLLYNLVPDAKKIDNGYTQKEINDYKRFTFHVLNDTIIDQSIRLMDNIKEVNNMAFPQDIPVLKIIAKQSLDAMAKRDKDDGMGYQNAHLSRLGAQATHTVLDATHFVYHTKVKEIVQLTNDCLASTNSK